MRILLVALTLALSIPCFSEDKWPQVTDLDWRDLRQHNNQRQYIDEMATSRLGQSLHKTESDLNILQRIVDQKLIEPSDSFNLQALGVVLGDLFVERYNLQWKIYQDEEGRSRATCVPNTSQCLFPVTMLSRRIEVGLHPDVQAIYQESAELIKPYLPKLPYQVD
ncbi:DUF3806 domain-containing protein [Halioxenophilus sp. WMMB6]|uniref:DUF3806 domain-containing protein n=1 Tax=Halioxenophilus sp. WMMB6 TaxID=3073815 RepID=UPI00295F2E22|nr:DUF3806 domain-containing protein [Halioxenophilus sp. WMMB6]